MRPKIKPRRRTSRKTLADQLRDAIRESGETDYALAQAAGLDPSSIGRFLRDERSWTLDTADQLAEVLGLELVFRRGRRAEQLGGDRRGRPPLPDQKQCQVTSADPGAAGDDQVEEREREVIIDREPSAPAPGPLLQPEDREQQGE